ncbi:T9SS C-terminal target domain-containing protein, partial [Bacteroidota bacterium]
QNKDYLFIGDFGNNNGNRNNLVIYRIPKSDLLKENASIVTAERINFTYPDQIDYSSKPFNTKFDCEAFVCSGDSLYLFSKDWINLKTRLFSIPSHPGSYTAVLKDSIDAKGLITSATISHDLNKIYLIGYTKGFPSTSFLIKLSDYKKQDFFTGKINRYDFSIPHTTQTEAIATGKDDVFYLSSEKGFKKNAKLFSIVIR